MQQHPTHKTAKGFTLIELVIAVAVIGILTSVAVLGYNQYKVRAYDAHSKQALRDILLQCNAFWLDHDTSQVCNHATVAEVYVASDEIVLKFPAEDLPDLPGGSQGNFCASAQHESSPNTYSIDSVSLISEGSDCSGTSGSVQTASAPESIAEESVQTASTTVAEPEKPPCTTIKFSDPMNNMRYGMQGWCVTGMTGGIFPDDEDDGVVHTYQAMDPRGQIYWIPGNAPGNRHYNAIAAFTAEGNEIVNTSDSENREASQNSKYGVFDKFAQENGIDQ